MSNIKIIAAIVGLVVLGFVAGFVTNRQMQSTSIDKMRKLSSHRGMLDHLAKKLELTEIEEEQVAKVVESYGQRFEERRREMRKTTKPIIDSMEIELKRVIPEDQHQALDAFFEKMKRGRKNHEKRRHHHNESKKLDNESK